MRRASVRAILEAEKGAAPARVDDDFRPALPIVGVEWLGAHLDDPDLVVLDTSYYCRPRCDARGLFMEDRVAGGRFFDIDTIADPSTTLPHMIPDERAFGEALGVGDGDRIVVYDGVGLVSAARAWWMFLAFGDRRVAVLDGGLPAWIASGGELEFGNCDPRAARVHRALRPFVLGPGPRRSGGAGRRLGPGRRRAQARAFPGPGSRAVAGGQHRAYAWRGQPADDHGGSRREPVRSRRPPRGFRRGRVDVDRPVVTTCGSGVTAPILNMALARLGKPIGRLYDGSWAEWGAHADFPAVRG